MPNLSHAIRNFNRFELKYLVSLKEAEVFKKALGAHLLPDGHGDSYGSYKLASLYYDSPDFRIYWEKMDGIRYRRKLRIRAYGDEPTPGVDTPVFVEIKQRVDRVTQKRRVPLPLQDALQLIESREVPSSQAADNQMMNEVISMCWQYDLRPAALITYQRQALIGSDYDIGLRVTFDHDLRSRTHNLRMDDTEPGQLMFPPEFVVMEIKVNERIPYWMTELVAQHNFKLVRMSKYCRSIDLARQPQAQTSKP